MKPAPPVTRAVPATERQRRWSGAGAIPRRIPRTREGTPYPYGLRERYIADKMRTVDFGGSRMGEREVQLRSFRRLVAVGAVLVLATAWTGSAFAATPQKIYRDLADNGKLDGKYTRAEIERAFNLEPVVRTDKRPPTLPREPIVDNKAPQSPEPSRARQPERRVPFSTLDAALLVAGGGPLLLIGAGLRRRLAPQPNEAPVPSA